MKTVFIKCDTCGQKTEKRAAEIKRRLKKGKTKFYCNLTCYGKHPSVVDRIKKNKSEYDISQHSGNRKDEYSDFRTHLRRAKRRKHECSLVLEDLKEIWTGRCAITNLPIVLYPENEKSDLRSAASLDRIDSSKGYIKENIQWVSAVVNLAKSSMSNDDMKEWINEIKRS